MLFTSFKKLNFLIFVKSFKYYLNLKGILKLLIEFKISILIKLKNNFHSKLSVFLSVSVKKGVIIVATYEDKPIPILVRKVNVIGIVSNLN